MKFFSLIIYLLICAKFTTAQISESDSLINLLTTAKEDTNKVHLYWNIGASIIYQDPQGALPYFKKGAALATQLGFVSGMEKCHNATSLAFSVNAKYDSALVYINYAIPYAIKAGNTKRLGLAYLNRADVDFNLRNYAAALKDCDTAIIYAQKAGSNDALGRIYSIINGVYRSLNQHPKALASLDKSDYYFGLSGNQQMIGLNYSERAAIFIIEKDPAKAVPLISKAIAIADSLKDVENLAGNNYTLGSALLSLDKIDAAESAFSKALKYVLQTGNTRQQVLIYQALSQVELERKNFSKAIDFGLKAYGMAKKENDLQKEQVVAATLAIIYHKARNDTAAYNFLTISSTLSDSIVRQNFSEENLQLQNSFEAKEKDRSILLLAKDKELQQQKIKQQLLLTVAVSAVALLILIGAWMRINKNKLKERLKELELRNQIAADLHDEVGSSLSSIHMLSQMATTQTNDDTHKDILARMSNNAKETMDKMGDIVWMIKPGETEAGNLKQRMERFAYEICSSKNIEVNMQLDDLEKTKLNMEQRKNIYLIFKEAVNNSVKYSGTEKIEITSTIQNNQLTLLVKDFGKGFDSSIVKKGNGLDNMNHRAKDLKALLEVTSNIGSGTLVKLFMTV